MDQPLVTAQLAALHVYDRAIAFRFRADLADHAGIITLRDEANVLAVGLHRDNQLHLGRHLAHLRLGQTAQWEAQIVELVWVVANRK